MHANEGLIHDLKEVRSSLRGCITAYGQLIPLIEDEHAAVKEHNLNLIEACGKQKTKLSEIILLEIETLQANCDRVTQQYFGTPRPNLTLEDLSQVFEDMLPLKNSTPFQVTIWTDLLIQVQASIDELLETMKGVVPKIECNRFTLQRLLRNHQESYKFWENITCETLSQYNEKGKRDTFQRDPHIQIKA